MHATDRQHFHFIGVCGTAMGSLAAALRAGGHRVSGSDASVYPPMSTFLEDAGIEILEGYRAENLPAGADVIVVGNAISRGNPEVEEVLDRKLLYQSMPEVLKQNFLRGRRNLVISGTHGKTTTASLAAWLLESAGHHPSFLIGGLPRNFGAGARFTDSPFVVLEGDEYDTAFFDKRSKFLHYLPELVVVNNIEFDHADIFESLDAIKLSFRRLLNLVPRNGCVLVNADDAHCLEVAAGCPAPVRRVGFGAGADHRLAIESPGSEGTAFTIDGERFEVPLPGEYNVRNAAMAVLGARFAGLGDAEVRAGLASFAGVARRMDLRGETRGVRIVDDFAHHPTALRQAVDAVRQRWPGARVWAVFEPRSNTARRNIFQTEFGEALAAADGAVIAAVANPEKVADAERLDPEAVVAALRARGRSAWCEPGPAEIVARLRPLVAAGDVVAVFSNGGFGGLHDRLLREL